jgi:uncharacterized membrane protein YkoI
MKKMKRKTIIGVAVGTAAVAAAAVGGVTVAATSDDDTPITGDALERATAVALDHLGGGTVTDTEEGDEDSYYEVEVTLEDGRQVDVQLDRDFNVVGSQEDDPGEADND